MICNHANNDVTANTYLNFPEIQSIFEFDYQ